MKIKNILTACLVCCGFAAVFTSCSKDEDGHYTISDADAPRILNTDFEHEDPDNADSPIVFKIDRNQNLTFEILVTPTDMTTVNWYADDVLVHQGKKIDRAFEAGEYTLKIVAVTTAGKQTSRTAKLTVKALENDPITTDDVMERLQTPGAQQQITGTRLGNIKKVAINGREMDVTSQSDSYVNYVLPADMPVGQYRLSLIDADGVSYGGGLINISGEVVISKAKFSGQSKGQLNLQGRKLTEVAGVTVNGTACEITRQDVTSMTVKLPEMEEGTYDLKATTTSGAAVKFLNGSEMVETATIAITLIVETVLWEGEHNVTWGTPFDKVQNTFADNVHVGAKIHIYVNGNAGAQGCLATAWWRNIYTGGEEAERGDLFFEGEFVMEYILTEKSMELMKEQNGVLVVGNGYTVTKVSVVEQTVWEGEHSVTWGTPFDKVQNTLPEMVHPGTTVRLYVNGNAGAQGCLATAWWRNIITGGEEAERGDRFFEGETVLEFKLVEKSMELMKEQNGVLVVGNGYTLTKVAIM